MNIKELLKKENKKLKDYNEYGWYDFSNTNLTSLEGLPKNFNKVIDLSFCKLKNLEGLPKNFNKEIWLGENPIESLDGINVLDPYNIVGLEDDFIVSEYRRLGKMYLLI